MKLNIVFCQYLLTKLTFLFLSVTMERASYRSIEGDQYDDEKKASQLYGESEQIYKMAIGMFRNRKIEKTTMAARNLNGYAVLMRSWANLL